MRVKRLFDALKGFFTKGQDDKRERCNPPNRPPASRALPPVVEPVLKPVVVKSPAIPTPPAKSTDCQAAYPTIPEGILKASGCWLGLDCSRCGTIYVLGVDSVLVSTEVALGALSGMVAFGEGHFERQDLVARLEDTSPEKRSEAINRALPHWESVRLRLLHGDERTWLCHACKATNRYPAEIRNALKEINQLSEDLATACKNGDIGKVKSLLGHTSRLCLVFSTTGSGLTPLHWAASRGHMDIVQLLLDCGTDINARSYFRNGYNSALHYAAENGHDQIVGFLLAQGAEVSTANSDGDTPLHVAAERGSRNHETWVVKLLLTHGAKVDQTNNKGETPLALALSKGRSEIVDLLLGAGANTSVRDKTGDTTLMRSISAIRDKKDADRDKWMTLILKLANQAEVNAKSSYECRTALHKAVASGLNEVVKVLLARGADVNAKDESGETPLHLAGRIEIAKVLLSSGADLNVRNNNGYTVIHCYALWGKADIVQFFLSKGLNVNAKDIYGRTALHMVAADSSFCAAPVETAKVLIAAKVDVNAKDNEGKTALATTKKADLAVLLRQHGAHC